MLKISYDAHSKLNDVYFILFYEVKYYNINKIIRFAKKGIFIISIEFLECVKFF